jgi:hypothetical protein
MSVEAHDAKFEQFLFEFEMWFCTYTHNFEYQAIRHLFHRWYCTCHFARSLCQLRMSDCSEQQLSLLFLQLVADWSTACCSLRIECVKCSKLKQNIFVKMLIMTHSNLNSATILVFLMFSNFTQHIYFVISFITQTWCCRRCCCSLTPFLATSVLNWFTLVFATFVLN